MDQREGIAQNLAEVRARIGRACERSGREPASVTLIGVTKKKPLAVVQAAVATGIRDIGENYVQEMVEKHEALGEAAGDLRWHFIGHLQRNKVRAIAPFTAMVHAVDSERLGLEIGRQGELLGRRIPVLLQVNSSGEASKFGVEPAGALELGRQLAAIPGIDLQGLMTLAAFLDDPESVRPMFSLLRGLRDRLRDPLSLPLPHLSMGMTNDFEVAIEEGATLVRIGTALFGEREQLAAA